jgi:tRNA-dihydrouridine synthase C
VREAVAVPVVANGEIWTVDDARRCRAESGCDALMLGRGQVADPWLALAIRGGAAGPGTWEDLLPLLRAFWDGLAGDFAERHRPGRLKQWLNLLRRRFPAAQAAWERARTLDGAAAVEREVFGGPAPGEGGPATAPRRSRPPSSTY